MLTNIRMDGDYAVRGTAKQKQRSALEHFSCDTTCLDVHWEFRILGFGFVHAHIAWTLTMDVRIRRKYTFGTNHWFEVIILVLVIGYGCISGVLSKYVLHIEEILST